MIDPVWDHYDGTPGPLQSVLQCFPAVCYPQRFTEVLSPFNLNNSNQVAKKITGFIWSTDAEVSNTAVHALEQYILLSPDEHILIIVQQMLEFIEQTFSQPSDKVLYALKNFCIILDFYVNYMESSKIVPKIDPAVWRKIRESMEIFSFLLFLHNEPQVWTKTCVLLSVLKKNILK
jgi:hypothetical protein